MISQPRDPNHPLYKLIDDMLIPGDQKIIAIELEVSDASVSLVKNGKMRSQRIWNRIIAVVMERKKIQDQVMKTLKQPAI